MENEKRIPLGKVMALLGLRANALARESGVDHSLIVKWISGKRPLKARSTQLRPLAEALLRLDTENRLAEVLAPYRQRGESEVEALCEYLAGELPALAPRAEPVPMRNSGEYIRETRVFFGKKGFYKVALANVDYLSSVPPGMELAALCQGSYEWFTGSIPFLLQFLAGLRKAVQRGGRFLVIIRKGYTATETALFAGPWLLFHLRGYIRSRYYEGELPEGVRIVASIPGYLGTWVEEDAEAADNLCAELHTDPRSMRRSEAAIAEYRVKSKQSSQYGFFREPAGDEDNPKLWRPGPLPAWERGKKPSGCFHALCRVPGFGILTTAQLGEIAGKQALPDLPEYLFPKSEEFAPGPHRVILCREEVRAALKGRQYSHEALSALLGRTVYVPGHMLRIELMRLLAAMGQRADFEVALMPRVAFEKIQMEMICWKDSVSVAWLQDMQESVFADEAPTSGSFHGFLDYVWDKMLAGWKRKERVGRDLRKWLAGQELDRDEHVSAIVRNWDVLPKD